jgi:uncharacterized SAM-binding protein YcdF (DUF218 family)
MSVVILHCGGNVDRTRSTAHAAASTTNPSIVISAELEPEVVKMLLVTSGILRPPVCFDFRPWDTLTHFTVIVDALADRGTTELHVVTDRFHLRRAVMLARIVCWRRGIRVLGHPHDDPTMAGRKDPTIRLLKDLVRALVWRTTRHLMFDAAIRTKRLPSLTAAAAEAHALGLATLAPKPLTGDPA